MYYFEAERGIDSDNFTQDDWRDYEQDYPEDLDPPTEELPNRRAIADEREWDDPNMGGIDRFDWIDDLSADTEEEKDPIEVDRDRVMGNTTD